MISFRIWIKQFKDDDTAIGDLARDIISDSGKNEWQTFPKKNNQQTILDYLYSKSACYNAIKTFNEAWVKYEPCMLSKDVDV